MEHIIKREGNKFYLGDTIFDKYGEIDFHIDVHNRIVITHSFVDPKYRGMGLANKLLVAVIALAIDTGQKIIPVCPFVIKVMTHGDKYKHLLDPSFKG
jgi:predicted GNAT family acetyltransferase